MSATAQIDSLLRGVGRPLGLDLSLDDTGRCGLSFARDLVAVVAAFESSNDVLFFASIAPLPSADRASMMERLLSLNLHATETDGAALGIDAGQGAVVLSRRWPCEMVSPETFGVLLGNFLATAERLHGVLGSGSARTVSQVPDAPPPSSDDLLRNFLWRV